MLKVTYFGTTTLLFDDGKDQVLLSDKYDVTQHPLYKETGEYDERNKLDIQRFLHQGIKVKSGEMFDAVRV